MSDECNHSLFILSFLISFTLLNGSRFAYPPTDVCINLDFWKLRFLRFLFVAMRADVFPYVTKMAFGAGSHRTLCQSFSCFSGTEVKVHLNTVVDS